VLTHGFVVDGEGRKMSKSLGNVISPQDIIKESGADILRLWVASSDYNEDIRISKEILKRLSEAYRKIRNTARFILSNLYDFSPDTDAVSYEELLKLDKWILGRLQEVLTAVNSAYDNFEFHKAYKGIYDFCNVELSMYYLDMAKGRLYTYAEDSRQRRSAQTTIYELLNTLVRLMAPLLVFSAEEIWQNLKKKQADQEISSVHLAGWPQAHPQFRQEQDIDFVIGLIPEAAKMLEELRGKGQIGSSFDAKIKLLTKSQDRFIVLTSLKDDLCEIFKVSQVMLEKKDDLNSEIAIEVSKADGYKCVRCWNYAFSVGKDSSHPELCVNCLKAIGG
jgi:isoleucyl-tRNA synthetase